MQVFLLQQAVDLGMKLRPVFLDQKQLHFLRTKLSYGHLGEYGFLFGFLGFFLNPRISESIFGLLCVCKVTLNGRWVFVCKKPEQTNEKPNSHH